MQIITYHDGDTLPGGGVIAYGRTVVWPSRTTETVAEVREKAAQIRLAEIDRGRRRRAAKRRKRRSFLTDPLPGGTLDHDGET